MAPSGEVCDPVLHEEIVVDGGRLASLRFDHCLVAEDGSIGNPINEICPIVCGDPAILCVLIEKDRRAVRPDEGGSLKVGVHETEMVEPERASRFREGVGKCFGLKDRFLEYFLSEGDVCHVHTGLWMSWCCIRASPPEPDSSFFVTKA